MYELVLIPYWASLKKSAMRKAICTNNIICWLSLLCLENIFFLWSCAHLVFEQKCYFFCDKVGNLNWQVFFIFLQVSYFLSFMGTHRTFPNIVPSSFTIFAKETMTFSNLRHNAIRTDNIICWPTWNIIVPSKHCLFWPSIL